MNNSPTLMSAPPTCYVNPFPTAATELSLSMRLNAAPLFCYLTRYGLDVHNAITNEKRTGTPYQWTIYLLNCARFCSSQPSICSTVVSCDTVAGMILCDSRHVFFILICWFFVRFCSRWMILKLQRVDIGFRGDGNGVTVRSVKPFRGYSNETD